MTDQLPIAVISGASRGLGFETCRQLGQRGYRVLLTARDHGKGKAAAAALQDEGLKVEFYPLDVTDAESVQALTGHLEREVGRLDVLVNNAGVFLDPMPPEDPSASSVFRADIATVRYSMETNAYGPLRLCQALIPLMRGQRPGGQCLLRDGTAQRNERLLSGLPLLQGVDQCPDPYSGG